MLAYPEDQWAHAPILPKPRWTAVECIPALILANQDWLRRIMSYPELCLMPAHRATTGRRERDQMHFALSTSLVVTRLSSVGSCDHSLLEADRSLSPRSQSVRCLTRRGIPKHSRHCACTGSLQICTGPAAPATALFVRIPVSCLRRCVPSWDKFPLYLLCRAPPYFAGTPQLSSHPGFAVPSYCWSAGTLRECCAAASPLYVFLSAQSRQHCAAVTRLGCLQRLTATTP